MRKGREGRGGRFRAGWELELSLNDAGGICSMGPGAVEGPCASPINWLSISLTRYLKRPTARANRMSPHPYGLVNPIESGGHLGLS